MPGEFSVNLWESHPDQDNDDCSTGESFETEAEARACMANLDGTFNMVYYRNTPFVELDGPGVHEVVERPGVRRRARQEERLEGNEHAMQMGMGLGIHAYNEAMGADVEEYPGDDFEGRAYQEWRRDQRREAEG